MMVKTTKSSFKLPINILNMYKYHFPTTLNQGSKIQIYQFWGLIWPFKWVLGVFTVFPMWGGEFTLAGSPKAQLIMHCLQHELWQSASIMHPQ
jgi:hypothetical protein